MELLLLLLEFGLFLFLDSSEVSRVFSTFWTWVSSLVDDHGGRLGSTVTHEEEDEKQEEEEMTGAEKGMRDGVVELLEVEVEKRDFFRYKGNDKKFDK